MKKIISLLLAFLFGCLTVSVVQGQDGKWGDLKGSFVLTGKVPEIELEKIDKDKKTCLTSKDPVKDDKLIVGGKGELKNVVVMMYLKKGAATPAVHPSYEKKKEEAVVLDNKNCRFVPHVTFVRTGQKLILKNSDEAGHNCHIMTFNNELNVNLPANDQADVKLDKADKTPGNVVCDVHPWMDAVILVRDEPYAAISAEDGSFSIKNIPAGKWKFQFWHKKAGYLRKLEIKDYKVGRRGEIEIEIKDGETVDLGKMELPSSSLKK